jgi:hypothetical protein
VAKLPVSVCLHVWFHTHAAVQPLERCCWHVHGQFGCSAVEQPAPQPRGGLLLVDMSAHNKSGIAYQDKSRRPETTKRKPHICTACLQQPLLARCVSMLARVGSSRHLKLHVAHGPTPRQCAGTASQLGSVAQQAAV